MEVTRSETAAFLRSPINKCNFSLGTSDVQMMFEKKNIPRLQMNKMNNMR